MCGILGILAFGGTLEKKQERTRQEAMIFLSSELLQLTQSRGKDATGISTLFSNCDYMGLKMGIPPTDFVTRFGGTEKDFDGYLNIWRKKSVPARMVLGHCRKSSVGNSEDNVNNHPIKVGDIIGVHNGTLSNHDHIFKLLKCDRDGTVDSEAIFRLLHHFTNNGTEPFSPEVIQEVCKRLHGSYSCLAVAGNNPYQMVGFRDARPMEALLIKPLKLLLIASDKDFLKHVIFRYNKMANLYHTGVIEFPSLKKNDVELLSLYDDSLYIFDIRKEIEDTSKIPDLFISEKIPRIHKIWDSPTTAYNQYVNRSANKTSIDDYSDRYIKRTEDKKENVDRIGMAWNKEVAAYQNITKLEDSKRYSNVEIDSINGEVIDAETGKTLINMEKKVVTNPDDETDKKFGLSRTYNGIDSLITTQAKVNELPIPIPVTESSTKDKHAIIPDQNKTEVILDTYPEVLEKAGIALQEEENFSNEKEVQLALEIEREEDLKRLPLYSLANRIKRFFYKKGWYNGYTNCLHTTEKVEDATLSTRSMFIRVNNKRKIAEKNIRTMKSIIQVFNNITTDYQVDLDGAGEIVIDKAVKEVLSGNNELDVDTIKNIFKPGDLRNKPILEKITSSVALNNQGR
jgi:hypothetical protein